MNAPILLNKNTLLLIFFLILVSDGHNETCFLKENKATIQRDYWKSQIEGLSHAILTQVWLKFHYIQNVTVLLNVLPNTKCTPPLNM